MTSFVVRYDAKEGGGIGERGRPVFSIIIKSLEKAQMKGGDAGLRSVYDVVKSR